MRLEDFDFSLPDELIASQPLPERSESRLMYLDRATGAIKHQHVYDMPTLLQPGDLLVFNNTKVIPARLYGMKATGGKVEVLLERILDEHTFLAKVGTNKRVALGTRILITEDVVLIVIAKQDDFFVLQLDGQIPMEELFLKYGEIPLPPYIQRRATEIDQDRYQTVFAEQLGAVAAPTAGLHFDHQLLQRLTDNHIEIAFITLHVGAGTFQPVRVAQVTEHKMHHEYCEVSAETCERIKACKQRGGRVIAVGTTVTRSLETAALSGEIKPYYGETNIFIYGDYQFHCIDGLFTNFHLPKSTLLMLVSAFAGYEHTMHAYRVAVAEKYRFFSYGDAMLII